MRRGVRGRWGRAGAVALTVGALAVGLSALDVVPAAAQRDRTAAAGAGRSPAGEGRAVFRDPVSTRTAARIATQPATSVLAPYPLDQTLTLHSLPGSQHTIFLDFDGAVVSGTAWNEPDIGLEARGYRGWVVDGDNALGTTELRGIQSIWQRVAEDYAPFDVDVTTQDPGPEALDRSGPDDPVYGTRVLVTSSNAAMRAACVYVCSGSAWFDVFDLATAHDYYQPALVFPRMLGDDVKNVAEAVSHEVGHNFGLLHDGTATDGYYGGHRSWAPIMGAGFGRPIVQWSRGDYAGANNQQDDLALIAANGAPLRADEAGPATTGAGPLPAGTSYITDDADVDVYALGTCVGPVVVAARRAPVSPDLDIRLRLLRADGSVVASANPPAVAWTRDRARGLSATIGTTVTAGTYFVAVDGVGHQGPVKGYGGYASVGSYTLRQTGCVAT